MHNLRPHRQVGSDVDAEVAYGRNRSNDASVNQQWCSAVGSCFATLAARPMTAVCEIFNLLHFWLMAQSGGGAWPNRKYAHGWTVCIIVLFVHHHVWIISRTVHEACLLIYDFSGVF